MGVLCETYLRERVRAQTTRTQRLLPSFAPSPRPQSLSLPAELIAVLRDDQTVLLAGAGMSLAAGYPGAQVLSELIVTAASQRGLSGTNLGLSGSIQEVAENFEMAYGRRALLDLHRNAFSPPQLVRPLPEHVLAVTLFKTILTTNHDELLEVAARESNRPCAVVSDDVEPSPPGAGVAIVKLAGTISQPESLVITSRDAWNVRGRKPRLWAWMTNRLNASPLVVVGHSLRDLNAKALFEGRPSGLPGFIVGTEIGSFEARRFAGLGLTVVHADAHSFFHSAGEVLGFRAP